MKPIFLITRILTGALFIFSGLVKLNDPSGFAIKLNEYFDVFAEDLSVKQDSIAVDISLDSQSVFQEHFALYESDITKQLMVETEADSLNNASLNIKWGGIERRVILNNLPAFPMQWQAKISILSDENTEGNAIELPVQFFDSMQRNRRLASHQLEVNLSDYVKPASVGTLFFKALKTYALYLSVFFCALEVWLGLALFLGYQIRFTVWITALLIGFFTFLTWYSAAFNKVTDCGCFGDFIKLKPWDSFKKDVVLTGMVIILLVGMKHNHAWLKKRMAHVWMSVSAIVILGFGFFCYWYLPVWDFLPYKKGNDINYIMNHIPEGERASDSIQVKFVMQKGSDSIKVTTLEYAEAVKKGYQFVRQDRKVIVEGYKSPIHDFAIYNLRTGEDLKDQILNDTGFKLLLVMPFLSETYSDALPLSNKIYQWCQEQGIPFYGLSSASLEPVIAFAKVNQLEYPIYAADQKTLMTMARYNPTLFVLKGSVIIDKCSGRNLPSPKALSQLIETFSNKH